MYPLLFPLHLKLVFAVIYVTSPIHIFLSIDHSVDCFFFFSFNHSFTNGESRYYLYSCSRISTLGPLRNNPDFV
uniref:Uncharacterized protein n=1 Tax=Helianthus annuus TaxID=4232 RepID=A0A251TKF4_HELAN